jgi:hypothetical protein
MPGRVTAVFAGLVVATGITWWLGSAPVLTGGALGVTATLTIVIALAKVYIIGRDFMELREAPLPLRAVFTVWVGAFAATAVALVVL